MGKLRQEAKCKKATDDPQCQLRQDYIRLQANLFG